MLTKRRNDVHITVRRERIINSLGDLAGAAVCSRKIGRQQKNSAKFFSDPNTRFI
jgi:hypothetical protein